MSTKAIWLSLGGIRPECSFVSWIGAAAGCKVELGVCVSCSMEYSSVHIHAPTSPSCDLPFCRRDSFFSIRVAIGFESHAKRRGSWISIVESASEELMDSALWHAIFCIGEPLDSRRGDADLLRSTGSRLDICDEGLGVFRKFELPIDRVRVDSS